MSGHTEPKSFLSLGREERPGGCVGTSFESDQKQTVEQRGPHQRSWMSEHEMLLPCPKQDQPDQVSVDLRATGGVGM